MAREGDISPRTLFLGARLAVRRPARAVAMGSGRAPRFSIRESASAPASASARRGAGAGGGGGARSPCSPLC